MTTKRTPGYYFVDDAGTARPTEEVSYVELINMLNGGRFHPSNQPTQPVSPLPAWAMTIARNRHPLTI